MAETAKQNQGNDGSSSLAGFAALSEKDFMDIESSDKKEETIEAVKTADEEKKEDNPDPAEKKVEEEKKAPVDAEKKEAPVDKKEEKKEEEKEEEGFKTEGSTLENKEDEEAKWVDIAKEIGFELKEDTYEAFAAEQKTFIENIKKTAVEDAKLKSFKDEIAELPAESQLLIIGLRQGLTPEQIDAPFKMIREYKALSDADLVAKDLELQGFTPDVVANEIEKMTENDKIEVEAKRLRTVLDQSETGLTAKKLQEVKELEASSQNIFKEKLAKESEEIVKHINKFDKFLDSPVSKKNKEYLTNKWNTGAYHELAKDPEKIVKFMLWNEFGEQGVANLKNNLSSKLKEEEVRKGHNVPPVISTGSSTNVDEGAKNPIANWGALEHLQET